MCYKIWRDLNFKLISGPGVYYMRYNASYQSNGSTLQYKQNQLIFGLTLGAGLQYNFNKQISGNVLYKLQMPFEKIHFISGISMGLAYNFDFKEVDQN